MVSTWCSGLLLFFAATSSIVCTSFTKTTRGFLSLHWVLINYINSSSDYTSSIYDVRTLLLCVASILMILEHVVTSNRKEYVLSKLEQITLFVVMFLFDVTFVSLASSATMEVSLLTFLCLIFVIVTALRAKALPPNKLTKQKLLSIHSADLFSDSQNYFHCLGLMGEWHLCAISATILLQVPVFNSWKFARYLIYVLRSLGTLSMLFCPCFFGGFVQALKTLGAKLGVKRLKSNQNTNKLICDS